MAAADLRSWPGTGLACQSCYQDARRQPCANCGATGRVAARGPGGPSAAAAISAIPPGWRNARGPGCQVTTSGSMMA